MTNLVDSSVWIDYFRRNTPKSIKITINKVVNNTDIVICEPVLFELLRAAPSKDQPLLEEYFGTIPVLYTPKTLWHDAQILGQTCVSAGYSPRSMDLLIAQVAIHHGAYLTAFDKHFDQISKVSTLNLNLLQRK